MGTYADKIFESLKKEKYSDRVFNQINQELSQKQQNNSQTVQRPNSDLHRTNAEKQSKSGDKVSAVGDSAYAGLTGINANIMGAVKAVDDFVWGDLFQRSDYRPLKPIYDYYLKENERAQAEKQSEIENGNLNPYVDALVSGTVQAVPTAVLGAMSGGTSLAGQAATTGANLSTAQLAANTAKEIAKNPNFIYSAVQTFGGTYEDAKQNGADTNTAIRAALLNAIPQSLIEVSGGTEKLVAKLANKTKGLAGDVFKSALEEGLEEVLQYPVEGIVKKTTYAPETPIFSTKESAVINPKEMAENFAVGASVGGILGGASAGTAKVFNTVAENNAKKQQALQQSSNYLKPYTESDIKYFKQNQNNLIDGVDANFDEYAKSFYNSETKKGVKLDGSQKAETIYLGRLNDSVSGDVNSIISDTKWGGIDTSDFNVQVKNSDIVHFYDQHGSDSENGQIPLTPDIVAKLTDTISDPDIISLSDNSTKQDKPVLYFVKKINGYSVVLEAVSPSKKALLPKTMYAFKSDSQEFSDFVSKLKKSRFRHPIGTESRTGLYAQGDRTEALSNPTIPQEQSGVKNSIRENAENMTENRQIRVPESELKIMKAIAKNHKIPFEIKDLGVDAKGSPIEGKYENGVIYVSPYAKNPSLVIFKHELTHYLEKDTYRYDQLLNVVKSYYDEMGETIGTDYAAEIRKIYDNYRARGKTLEDGEAERELVANFAGKYLFTDEKAIQYLAGKKPSIARSILNWIREQIAAIKGDAESELLIRAERMYLNALKAADKRAEVNGNAKHSFAGENAKTANISTLNDAKSRIANGEDFGTAQADITAAYQSEVDKILNMQKTTSNNLIVGYTPELMRKMGMPSLPVVIGSGHVYSAVKTEAEAKQDGNYRKGVHYHGLGDAVVKNIYEKLQDPIMIIASKDVSPNAKPLRSSHSVVAIVDVGQTNKSLLLPVEITAERTVNGEQLDVNVLSSVYDRNVENLVKEAVALENSGDIGIYYAKKEANALIPAGVRFPIRIQKAIASNSIVRNFDQKVNRKISDATQSLQFKRWFGDWQNHPESASKVVNTDGTPKVLYHQTDAEFTVFNTDNQRAGRLDTDTPTGMFFKPTDQDIGISGAKQMAVYLNARNMLELKNREEAHTYWMEHIPQYAELQSQYDAVDETYNKRYEEVEAAGDEWYEQHYDDLVSGKISDAEAIQVMDAPLDELLDEWKAKTEPIAVRQKELVTEYMQKSPYDGMHLLYDGSRNGVDVETYIVFSPTQIKSATDNIGTFDGKNPDIRYSLSDDYDNAVEQYGAIPPGENPARDVKVPKQMNDNTKVRRTVRTAMEASGTPGELVDRLKVDIANDVYDYKVVSDKSAVSSAKDRLDKWGLEKCYQYWKSLVNEDRKISKNDMALAEQMYIEAAHNGDFKVTQELMVDIAEEATRAGQNAQSIRLLKNLTPEGRVYKIDKLVYRIQKEIDRKTNGKAKTIKVDENLKKRMLNAKSQEEMDAIEHMVHKNIAKQMPEPTKMEKAVRKWNEWRYLAMLGNPRTHIRNIFGNALFAPMVNGKNAIGIALERTLSKDNRTKARLTAKDKATIEFAKSDFDTVNAEESKSSKNKYNESLNGLDVEEKVFKNKALEWARKTNSNLLEWEDTKAKRKRYSKSFAQFIKARGWDYQNLTDSQLDSARNYAMREAKRATFQDTSEVANALNKFSHQNIATEVLVEGLLPFKKTPINILKRGVEYSPFGIAKGITELAWDVKKGNMNASQAIDTLSCGLSGTAMMMVGVLLSSLGVLISTSDDDKEGEFDKLSGNQEYALQFFGKSYTIDWIAPLSMPLFIGAEIENAVERGDADNGAGIGRVLDALTGISDPMFNLSMLQGINSSIKTVRYSDNPTIDLAANTVSGYLGQGIPTILGQTARTVDTTRRNSYYTPKDSAAGKLIDKTIKKTAAKIPGVSMLLEPYIDKWGNEQVADNWVLNAFENFASPGYYSENTNDSVTEEMARLYKATSDTGVVPHSAKSSLSTGGNTYRLSEKEYTQYQKTLGKASHEQLQKLINSTAYSNMSNEEKAVAVGKMYRYAEESAKVEFYKGRGIDFDDTPTIKKFNEVEESGVDLYEYLYAYVSVKDMESDKNASGETIRGSLKRKQISCMVNQLGIPAKTANKIYDLMH